MNRMPVVMALLGGSPVDSEIDLVLDRNQCVITPMDRKAVVRGLGDVRLTHRTI